jgi:hypothetical protein
MELFKSNVIECIERYVAKCAVLSKYYGILVVVVNQTRKEEQMKATIREIEEVKLSYEERQATWVKENDIKVGDTVEVMDGWSIDETDWAGDWVVGAVAKIEYGNLTIEDILGEGISVKEGIYYLPYTIFEKVTTSKFKPFTLEIKVENEDNLRELWHRFYSEPDTFDENGTVSTPQHDTSYATWDLLDNKCIELNMKKVTD